MSQISTKPVSGTRDFLPREARFRRNIFEIIEKNFQRYGFDPLDTPAMERLSTLLGKYGDEGDQLLFKVLKRGQKLQKAIENNPTEESLADAGLRYDLTVPLARVYAQYQNEFPRIFKRYQIAPVWRADRPQRGRYREFVQCDVDVVGSSSLIAEYEVVSVLSDILKELSFERFVIHVNHRDLLFATIEAAGISEKRAQQAIVTLDKLDKIGVDGVRQELLDNDFLDEHVEFLLSTLTEVVVDNKNNQEMLAFLRTHLATKLTGESLVIFESAIAQLTDLLELLEHSSAKVHVAIDPSLARGLSYYTGPIFEIRSPDFSGSIGGGGRYDKLIGMFRGSDVPAVGFSLGIERILMLMEEKMGTVTSADVLVTVWDDDYRVESVKLAQELRRAGLRTDVYCENDRYGKQFGYADERNIPYTVILAPEEVKAGRVKVKEMASGEQVDLGRDEVVGWIADKIRG